MQSLSVDASVARWGSTAETSGLAIDLFPVDTRGALVPVRGMLEVELIGSESIHSRPGRAFPVIGRWVQRVELADFASRGASYRLAFQQVHPETDLGLGPLGAVHAKLSVPGQGVFEATATIRIRPADPLRDRLQQATGGRFFPQERSTAGRR